MDAYLLNKADNFVLWVWNTFSISRIYISRFFIFMLIFFRLYPEISTGISKWLWFYAFVILSCQAIEEYKFNQIGPEKSNKFIFFNSLAR